jgi:hypothetical protein
MTTPKKPAAPKKRAAKKRATPTAKKRVPPTKKRAAPKAKQTRAKAKPGDKRLGNRFWEARYNTGRKPKTATPATLWAACVKYFEFLEDNPLYEHKVGFYQGEAFEHKVPLMRAPTLAGLCIFLGITDQTWYNWKNRSKGFLDVITRVDRTLYDWKFQGAAAGLLNANIIARDLKLTDHTDVTSAGEKVEGLRVEHV